MSQLNDFTYVDTDAAKDDTLGLRCPIGSHIRRNNPRNEAVVGTDATHHRIIRRAMPYGPAYDPAHPDTTPRGLIGYFINGSLTNQFEFLLGQWNLTPDFVKSATGPGGSTAGNAVFNISGEDVFMGVQRSVRQFLHAGRPRREGQEQHARHRLSAVDHDPRRRLLLSPERHGAAIPGVCLIRGASPLGLPDTLSRAPLRRRAPLAWLTRCRSFAMLVADFGRDAGARIQPRPSPRPPLRRRA